MNKSQRNNNPLNLRYAKQTEAVDQDGTGFAVFPTPSAGWRAAHAQIKLDQSRNLTVEKFLLKFAPPNENDSKNYLSFICSNLNIDSSILLDTISPFALAGVMAAMEGYYNKEA